MRPNWGPANLSFLKVSKLKWGLKVSKLPNWGPANWSFLKVSKLNEAWKFWNYQSGDFYWKFSNCPRFYSGWFLTGVASWLAFFGSDACKIKGKDKLYVALRNGHWTRMIVSVLVITSSNYDEQYACECQSSDWQSQIARANCTRMIKVNSRVILYVWYNWWYLGQTYRICVDIIESKYMWLYWDIGWLTCVDALSSPK